MTIFLAAQRQEKSPLKRISKSVECGREIKALVSVEVVEREREGKIKNPLVDSRED